MSTISVPLSKLSLSPLNVRQTTAADDTRDLEASILEHGLLAPLTAHPMARGRYGVIAGGRRLRAMQALVETKRLKADHPVDVMVRDEDAATATEISVIENTARVALPPAEEFLAFRKLADGGADLDAIARRFATTELHVRQRMRLGQLHPDILAALNKGKINLDVAKAYAATTDQDLQLRVFKQNPWAAYEVRAALKRDAVSAGVDSMMRLVGMDAYAAAGGRAEEDLFNAGEARVLDVDLLRSLYEEKLEAEKARLALPNGATLQFGWDGVGVQVEQPREQREADDEELEQLRAIDVRCDEISDRLDQIADWDQDGPADKLVAIAGQDQDEVNRLQAELKRLEAESERLQDADASPPAVDGPVVAVVAVRDGVLQVVGYHRPMGWRPEGGAPGNSPPVPAPDQSAKAEHGLSRDSVEVMKSHRRGVLASALVEESVGEKLAGRFVTFALARGLFMHDRSSELGVDSLPRHDYDPEAARGELAAQPGFKNQRTALERLQATAWMREPNVGDAFRQFAYAPEAEQRRALACVATAMLSRTLSLPGLGCAVHDVIGELLNIDVREHWTPDAKFFAKLPKGRRLDAVRAIDPAAASRLGNLGNAELTEAVAAIMSGSAEAADRYGLGDAARHFARNWAPAYLCFDAPDDPPPADEVDAGELESAA